VWEEDGYLVLRDNMRNGLLLPMQVTSSPWMPRRGHPNLLDDKRSR